MVLEAEAVGEQGTLDRLFLVAGFTDGIDECHYRSPETSVGYHHIAALAADVDYDPLRLVTELTQLALTGVDGNPGGQDNIAVIASAV